MLVWLKNAPVFEPDSFPSHENVCNFVDKIIFCSPEDLSEKLIAMQTHKHSHTCHERNNVNQYRFNIPYYRMNKTCFLLPLSEDHNTKDTKKYEKRQKKIQEHLNNDIVKNMSFGESLISLKISEEEYYLAIRTSLTKPRLFLRRKSSTKLSANAFYNNSELSIQEACYNILQIPLSRSSEECISIPTFPAKDRVRMRTKPRIIRYRNYHSEIDSDNFIRENLMLFTPWNIEQKDILDKNVEDLFTVNKDSISDNKKLFNAFSDETLSQAFREAMARTSDEENSTDNRTNEKFDFDEYTLNDEFTYANIETEYDENSCRDKVFFILPEKLPENKYQELFEKFNQDQRNYIMHVADNFEKTPTKQLLHFLTGGAGYSLKMKF
ncbi:Pheromone-regulated membrane protein 6 [Frankliniella fusca]|uniref:Pheromone-regulated membrane protein 6 n=1 Tax=Frankliniella fusca TaxID=407009 RepID=A0AAE1L834_9NEOP|nr:Pheromone-regulated membrane protein 6 [Frankliniella fusca]